MKLGKEEIQKLLLGGLLLLGVVYSYFDLLLFPLQKRAETARRSVAALGPEIQNSQGLIKKADDLEKASPQLTVVMRQVTAMIPDGSPVAWFPPKVTEFFKRQGIEKATSKFNNEVVDKELPGFRRLAWGIDLPKVEFAQFGAAICALENEDPLIEITTVQLDASRDDVESQRANLTVQNLVKQ